MCGQADDPSQHDRPLVGDEGLDWPGYTPEAKAYEIATRVERCVICKRVTDPALSIAIAFGGGVGAVCHVCQDREDPGFSDKVDEVDEVAGAESEGLGL